MKNHRIAIIGPESSGKSVLTKALAEELDIPYVKEYAREYFETHDYSNCKIDDLITIAKKQFFQCHIEPLNTAIVSDTEMFTMEIWAKDKFNFIPKEIMNLRKIQKFDLYILSSPDFEWIYDELRTDSHRRDEIFEMYLNLLNSTKSPFIIVNGTIDERVNKCIKYFSKIH